MKKTDGRSRTHPMWFYHDLPPEQSFDWMVQTSRRKTERPKRPTRIRLSITLGQNTRRGRLLAVIYQFCFVVVVVVVAAVVIISSFTEGSGGGEGRSFCWFVLRYKPIMVLVHTTVSIRSFPSTGWAALNKELRERSIGL